MNIQRAREILGEKYAKRTDEEMQGIIDTLKTLAEISIETVLETVLETKVVTRKT